MKKHVYACIANNSAIIGLVARLHTDLPLQIEGEICLNMCHLFCVDHNGYIVPQKKQFPISCLPTAYIHCITIIIIIIFAMFLSVNKLSVGHGYIWQWMYGNPPCQTWSNKHIIVFE